MLVQGVGNRVKCTNTIFFVHHSEVPSGKRVTYRQIFVSIRPNKAETHQVRITVGCDKLSYDGPTATQCASLITTKILLNSFVSTILAMFMCADIHDFYYNTPMVDYEYMKLPISMFPQEIFKQYNLKYHVAADGYVYIEIRKGIPGIKQAGRLDSDRLTKNLARNGYAPVPHTPSLWRHYTSDLVFSLFVDDFGIKYTRKADTEHLLKYLREDYEITEEWTGEKYLGLTLKWDYVNRNVSVSMPGYVKAALLKFQREATNKPQDALHWWNQPTYGAKTQYADTDEADLVDSKSTLYVQQVCGTF